MRSEIPPPQHAKLDMSIPENLDQRKKKIEPKRFFEKQTHGKKMIIFINQVIMSDLAHQVQVHNNTNSYIHGPSAADR